MTTRLVILGLLRGRPLYGYELKQIIEEQMGDWTSIAFGSIYFALEKLSEEGYIEKVATEQEGKRPSRSVYQITTAGREEFVRLLREVWNQVERQYYDIDVALAFKDALPEGEVKTYLRQRAAQLEGILEHIREHRQEQMAHEEVPPIADAVFDHGVVHYQAELAWTRQLLEKLEQGMY